MATKLSYVIDKLRSDLSKLKESLRYFELQYRNNKYDEKLKKLDRWDSYYVVDFEKISGEKSSEEIHINWTKEKIDQLENAIKILELN